MILLNFMVSEVIFSYSVMSSPLLIKMIIIDESVNHTIGLANYFYFIEPCRHPESFRPILIIVVT